MADGLLIKGSNQVSSNVLVNNVTSTNNARQALTMGSTRDAIFKNCNFSNTGITGGDYGRHAPSAGLDIEPNHKNQSVTNITFENCKFENNLGSEIVVNHPQTTSNINFNHCTISSSKDSKRKWEIIVNAKSVNFDNCEFNLEQGSI